MSEKRHNVYVFFCPCCGATVCGKCGQYQDRLGSLQDGYPGDEDVKWGRGVSRAWKKHLAEVDHSYIDEPGSALFMRIDIPEPVHTVTPTGAHRFDFTERPTT